MSVAPINPLVEDQPILHAFLYGLQLLGRQKSSTAFLAGLPHQDVLTTDLLMRACQRNGIAASRQAFDLARADELVQPVILLLDDPEGSVAVLEPGLNSTGNQMVSLFSQTGERISRVFSLDDFIPQFSGQAIVLGLLDDISPDPVPKPPGFRVWLGEELRKSRSVYRDVLIASVLVNLFVLASPLFVMNVYDRVVPNQAIETLWVLGLGVVVVFIFDLTIKLLRHYFVEQSARRADLVLSSRLFEHALNLKFSAFPNSLGAFASQFRELDSIKQFFTAATFTSLVDLPFALFFMLIIYSLGGGVVLAPIIAALLIICYGFAVHFPLKHLVQNAQHGAAQKQGVLVEALGNIETLKAFNAEGRFQGLWERYSARLSAISLAMRRLGDSLSLVSGFLVQLAVVAVVILGVYQITEHQMSMGALIACVLLTGRALGPMAQVANLAAQYFQARSAIQGLEDLTALPVEHGRHQRYLSLEKINGDIELKGVSFRYEPKSPVLSDINLRINAGEKVAIIGKVGSGKSTLLKLLLKLQSAERGMVKIDGLDLEQLDPAELRSQIAYVPQDTLLIAGTLRENIALKCPAADDTEILRVAKMAGLDELLDRHSMGLGLPIGENGHGLSGGQRQSVAIARALINDPSILLFDELTSAMDNQTESAVIDAISEFAKGRTMLLSTHRASLLKLVDRVIVMDKGRIIADGEKQKVLEALQKGLIQTATQHSAERGNP